MLRTDLRSSQSFAELVGRVKQVTLGAYAHQDLPFERLVAELEVARDASVTPLFQVVFVLQNAPAGELSLPGLSIAPFEIEQQSSKFDLLLTLLPSGQGYAGSLEYETRFGAGRKKQHAFRPDDGVDRGQLVKARSAPMAPR